MLAVLVTTHYLGSNRKAGFHWIAESLIRSGWEVLFLTICVSSISRITNLFRSDYRKDFPSPRASNRLMHGGEHLWSYVWFTPWHPAHLRLPLLNKLASPLFRSYGALPLDELEEPFRDADMFVFESSPGLLLFDRFRRMNHKARFVYRVSDDLRLLRTHPVVIDAERESAPRFDLVSVPCRHIYEHFEGLWNLKLHPHGIEKKLFDQELPSPYEGESGTNLVFSGTAYLDNDFLVRGSRLFPSWNFHVLGPFKGMAERENIILHGEMPFRETIPYVKFADIGLNALLHIHGAESFSDSLKVQQYTYCGLPIVAPEFMQSRRSNFYYYSPGNDESIRAALLAASRHDRRATRSDDLYTWDDLAARLVGVGVQ
jgi:2-beta-glucuronyltransferase